MDLEHLCTGNDMNRLMLWANLSVFNGLMQSPLLSLLNLKFEDLKSIQGGVGQNECSRSKQVTGHFYLYAKIKKPKVRR